MTSELSAGWQWNDQYWLTDANGIQVGNVWYVVAKGKWLIELGESPKCYRQTKEEAKQALLAVMATLRGELSPNVRDVLEQCRNFMRYEQGLIATELRSDIDALLSGET